MLYLCEKPSQARDIAKVLGVTQRHDGYLSGNGNAVTWCFGHLLEMAEPHAYDAQYKRWSLDSLPIIPSQWKLTTKKQAHKQFTIIKKLLKMTRHVVIATDADREGEVIAREVMEAGNFQGQISRLWLSALDDTSIRKALDNILPGTQTEALYHAGVARSRCDWLVGMNLTRFYSLKAQQAGYQGVLSVGRVQTPTLRMVVDRDQTIAKFIPKPYWNVIAILEEQNQKFIARWLPPEEHTDHEGRCLNKSLAQQVQQQIQDQIPNALATITSANTTRKKQAAPLLFSLSSLQQFCDKAFSMGANQVLETVQSLYEKHKATTYPRTDCEYLPRSQKPDATGILKQLSGIYPEPTQQANTNLISRAWNDKKVTTHHAIIPTNIKPNVSAMTATEKKVHDAICRRYLMQFYPAYEYDQTIILLDILQHHFKTTGKIDRNEGWKQVLPKRSSVTTPTNTKTSSKTNQAQTLPPLRSGQQVPVIDIKNEEKQTQPPKHYTEGTLIAAMKNAAKEITDAALKKILKETTGIGTEATRAAIIELLLKRDLLNKQKKYLKATEAGISLIQALPEAVKSPGTTALWEQSLEGIAEGKVSSNAFLKSQEEWLIALINQEKQKNSLSIKSTDNTPTISTTYTCPKCQNLLTRRKGKKGYFWGCSSYPDCTFTINDYRGKPQAAKSKPRKSYRRKKVTRKKP